MAKRINQCVGQGIVQQRNTVVANMGGGENKPNWGSRMRGNVEQMIDKKFSVRFQELWLSSGAKNPNHTSLQNKDTLKLPEKG